LDVFLIAIEYDLGTLYFIDSGCADAQAEVEDKEKEMAMFLKLIGRDICGDEIHGKERWSYLISNSQLYPVNWSFYVSN
jgi:hypothetical protein